VVSFQGNFAELKKIEQKDWLLLIGAGIATTLSTIFSYKALSLGHASAVTTIERSSLVFAVILSIVFLKEKITWQIIAGATLVLAGAIIIALAKPE
jgi:transporter family protein